MKKLLSLVLTLVLALALLSGCGGGAAAGTTTLKVGASVTPHAEILAQVTEALAAKNIKLEIVEYTDYVQPNTAVESGDLVANYFQHQPYLDSFNADNGTHLVSVAAIHYEPLGIYPGKTAKLADIPDGGKIAVPNDATNEARALLLLEAQGLIKIKEGAGLNATKIDIAANPKNLEIVEIEAAQLARSLPDVDFAVINGNYALQAELNPLTDAVAYEEKDSEAAKTYANILVVKEGNENNEAVAALIEALKSDAVRTYINDTYQGSVVPMF